MQLLNLMECGRNTHDIVRKTRSIVGVAVRGSNSGGARDEILFSPYSSRSALDPIQPPPRWILELFPGVKWPEFGVDYAPLFNAEVKNE